MRFFLLTLFFSIVLNAGGMPQKYYKISSKENKKSYFINHIYSNIYQHNKTILNERNFILTTFSQGILHFNYNPLVLAKLKELQHKYKVSHLFHLEDFLLKIDVVPPALAIAQAIVESGWGESRFAKEANNLFGQWTYYGDGLIPQNRNEGASHKIKIFDSLEESVYNYLLNINIGWGYKNLRIKRLELRKIYKNPSSFELANAIKNYSSIGQSYIKILKNIITNYNLEVFDQKLYGSLQPIGLHSTSLSISD